jgi:hypothetical protein
MSIQLKNVRSHRDDERLILCPDCGQQVKKKCFAAHAMSHMGRVVVGEETSIGMCDAVRKQNRDIKRFHCEEDDERFVHRM